eukprot:m.271344 g.271344  ORF g.271344 m.271344 type:complete len:76 (-) comp54775_c0_seq5:659-886(-)
MPTLSQDPGLRVRVCFASADLQAADPLLNHQITSALLCSALLCTALLPIKNPTLYALICGRTVSAGEQREKCAML